MNHIKTSLILLSLLGVPWTSVHALTFLGKPVYVGADFHMTNTGARTDWSQVFNRFHPGAQFYLGFRVWPKVSVELGHSWTTRSEKEMSQGIGSRAFNVTNTVNSFTTGRVRFKDTHIDLNLNEKITQNLKAIFSVGVGLSRQKILVSTTPSTSQIGTVIDPARGKSRLILRAGFGLEGGVTDNVSWRTMVRYSNTGSIRTRNTALTGRVFKDSVSIFLGLNYGF